MRKEGKDMAGRKRKKKRNRYRKHIIIWILLLLVTAHFCGGKLQQTLHKMPGETDWELIVVNKWNTIPDGYQTELTTLSNGKQVDSRIYPALQDLFDAMRADGIYPIVREGYRTTTDQQSILDDKIKAYEQEGLSSLLAKKMASEWVAAPGTSEHQLGIAVDINVDKTKSTNDEVYTWLAEHAWEYGFILRYPKDKENVTGTGYEPWHYRYVGKEAAKEIWQEGCCLEEYVTQN